MRSLLGTFYGKCAALSLAVIATATAIAVVVDQALGVITLALGATLLLWLAWNRRLEVIFTPSHLETVRSMLEMARIQPGEVVYDLGSGDGRLLILAARRYRARAVGVEFDPVLVWTARLLTRLSGVSQQVRIIRGSLHHAEVSDADVVFLYLNPRTNARLQPRLAKELRPEARVVSHAYSMPGWQPREVRQSYNEGRPIYLYDSQSRRGSA